MDKDMKETEMTVENLTHRIRETVEKYISQEECYGDDTQLRIDTTTLDIDLADPEDDLPECDYYPVMDLVRGSRPDTTRHPGSEGATALRWSSASRSVTRHPHSA